MSKKSLAYENPGWPDAELYGDHPVTDRTALVAGGLSPFGEEIFPIPASQLGYIHPYTVINRG